jgi:DNA-binding transcriptional MocR family regulator
VETISFARGVPGPDLLPVQEIADCAEAVLKRDGKTILSYGAAGGYTPLRELIAQWFGVHPFRVVLTNGSLQGFGMVASLRARSRTVYIEYPSYDRAIKVLLAAGASLVSVVVDEEGFSPDDFAMVLQTTEKPEFVYVIPTFQNPTGQTMTLARRNTLIENVTRNDILVYEDDPYALTRFEGEPLPALFDLSAQRSIYSSSFSKTISPGLRVGWTIVPEDGLAERMTELASATYITPVLLSQAIAYEFISRGSFEPNLRRVRELLRARRDAMLSGLERHFSGAKWSRPEGGFFIWLELPAGSIAQKVLERAQGVTAVAGPEFGGAPNTVRLAFSFAQPDEIETGLERLAAAVD